MAKEDGYIKISRKLDDWEHADNLAMIGFWVRLLLLASWEDKKRVKRGEIVTTIPSLAGICGCSEKTISRYLQKLKESGEIKTSTNHRNTKIRIVNYDMYQQIQKSRQYRQIDRTAVQTDVRTDDRTAVQTDVRTDDRTAVQTEDDSQPYFKNKRIKELKNKEINWNTSMSTFKKPTLEEVQEYISENLLTVDAQKFIDYYDSNGWMVGKNHMKDWKATIRNWERRNQEQFKSESKDRKEKDWFDEL